MKDKVFQIRVSESDLAELDRRRGKETRAKFLIGLIWSGGEWGLKDPSVEKELKTVKRAVKKIGEDKFSVKEVVEVPKIVPMERVLYLMKELKLPIGQSYKDRIIKELGELGAKEVYGGWEFEGKRI